MVNRKLGRTTGHRLALFRNQLASLIERERIITTLPKAKELRPQIERLITLGKNDSVHARRQAARLIENDTLVAKLFVTLGPRFTERPGGYTRIIKLGPRRGDAAEMAILEFVGYELEKESAPEPKGKKKDDAKKEPAAKKDSASKKEAASKDDEAEEKPKRSRKAAAPKAEAGDEKPKRAKKKKEE
jgi:large subunit ribosomal protein L17